MDFFGQIFRGFSALWFLKYLGQFLSALTISGHSERFSPGENLSESPGPPTSEHIVPGENLSEWPEIARALGNWPKYFKNHRAENPRKISRGLVDPQGAGIILSDPSISSSLSLTNSNISLLATALPPSWILNAKTYYYHQRRRRRKKATWYGSKKGQSGIEVWWWCSAAAADSDKDYPKLQIMRWKAKCRRHMKVGAVGRESPREKKTINSLAHIIHLNPSAKNRFDTVLIFAQSCGNFKWDVSSTGVKTLSGDGDTEPQSFR